MRNLGRFRPSAEDEARAECHLRRARWLTELNGDGGFEPIYFEEVDAGVDAAHANGGFVTVPM